MNITLTISLDEYLSHASNRGQRWVIIDETRRQSIISQANWELECHIQEIEDSSVFKLWRLSDWQFHKETNKELVAEKRIAEDKSAADNHRRLIEWRASAITALVTKGKMDSSTALTHVLNCIDPVGRLNIDDFEDDTDLLTSEVIKSKEKKLAEKVKFYFQLRTKLGWPFGDNQ